LQLCNNVEYISYCELYNYCYMCFVSLWPRNQNISADTIVEIQVTQLLTWNFARSVTDLRYCLN